MSLKLEMLTTVFDQLESDEKDRLLEYIFKQKTVFDLNAQKTKIETIVDQLNVIHMNEILRRLNFDAVCIATTVWVYKYTIRIWLKLDNEPNEGYCEIRSDHNAYCDKFIDSPYQKYQNFMKQHAEFIWTEVKKIQ
jgi:hypothetical protein